MDSLGWLNESWGVLVSWLNVNALHIVTVLLLKG